MLTGPLRGVHDPSGHGAALFAFFAGMAESDRDYIRERTLEGQDTARQAGKRGGRPFVTDANMADYARELRKKGVEATEIQQRLVIPSGKNKGQHPSMATVYRLITGTPKGEPTEE